MKECTVCNYCYPDSTVCCPRDGSSLIVSLAGPPLLAGRYQLKRQVGQGRLGTVYYGCDNETDRDVSIRILPAKLFSNQQAVDNFIVQLEALKAIENPHILQVLSWGKLDTGHFFVVTDFARGRSLRDELNKSRPIDFSRAVEIMCQVCRGVASAHRINVLHRDLKPDNIFLDSIEGKIQARVADFSIAAINANMGGSVTTDTGSVIIRVPYYTSPEECSGLPVDTRSDIYSLGIILYEMLTGQVPFQAPTPIAISVKHVSETPRPPRELNSKIPKTIEAVVLQTIEKDPAARPASAETLAEALQQALANCEMRQSVRKLQVVGSGVSARAGSAPLPSSTGAQVEKPAPPEAGLPVRLTIIDADDEGHKSRTINGAVLDLSLQGMHIQTSTVESDSLNIIKDHTVAFKNRLNIEIDLPSGTVHIEGFAVWYRPAPDGLNWNVGIYIKGMASADRELYETYLESMD